jgi:hypothetical protein
MASAATAAAMVAAAMVAAETEPFRARGSEHT